MTLASFLGLLLLGGSLSGPQSPEGTPSPTPSPNDDGDAATVFTEAGTEIEWQRQPGRNGRLKFKKAGADAEAKGFKKGDEIEGTDTATWGGDIHDLFSELEKQGSGEVRRGKSTVALPFFFASPDQIESSPHGLRPLAKASPIYARGPKGNFDLIKNWPGRVLVLNFWATWCGPCVKEMPLLDRLHQTYNARGVTFLGLNMDEDDAPVREYLQKNPITYLTVTVGTSRAPTGRAYYVEGIPLTAIVRPDGRIAQVGVGYRGDAHEKWLSGALDTVLKPDARPIFLIHRPSR